VIRLVLLGLVLVVVWWIWQRLQTPQPGEPPQLEGRAEPPPADEGAAATDAAATEAAEAETEGEVDEIECPVCQQLVTVDDHGNPTGGCSRPDCPWPLAASEGSERPQGGPQQGAPPRG